MTRFCTTMNMPPPVGLKPFRAHTKALLQAAKDVTEQTMKDAATTQKLRNVTTLWKLLFHVMEHGIIIVKSCIEL